MTVKLFDKQKKFAQEPEGGEETPQMLPADLSPAQAGKLVLDIEGLQRELDQSAPAELKAQTKDLPSREELTAETLKANLEQVKQAGKEQGTGNRDSGKESAGGGVLRSEASPSGDAPHTPDAPKAPSVGGGVLRSEASPSGDAPRASEAQKAPSVGGGVPDAPRTPEAPKAPSVEGGVPDAPRASDAPRTPEPEKPAQPLTGVSFESMAQAVETAKKEPTGRFDRDAVDDETLLAELYALIGDKRESPKPVPAPQEPEKPEIRGSVPRPAPRIRPEDLESLDEVESSVIEEDFTGVPGWIKGAFLLLLSLLLSAMTFYAVASDVVGKIF